MFAMKSEQSDDIKILSYYVRVSLLSSSPRDCSTYVMPPEKAVARVLAAATALAVSD